jgi:ABC-2 type transport system permease protein
LVSLGRFPLSVYPRGLEFILTFIVPIGMVASLPSSVLFGTEAMGNLVAALVASLVFVLASGLIFMKSLSRYQSVNSGV